MPATNRKSQTRGVEPSAVPDDPPEVPDDIPERHREQARELQMQLLVLEARLESANFEDKEAYRRKINEKRGELDSLRE
jgi:hypothetical protein